MEYLKLGTTGLDVSRICLGCMTYGVPDRGTHEWTLDEDASRPLIRQALEAGVTFFDTANVYSDGTSEEIVGRALRDFARRDDIVLATKVHGRMRPGPNGAGLSRKAIMTEIDHSLRRLGTDYVDLYQIHRWDPHTPVEETMEALHDLVKAGKVRYIGASSMYAWQFSKAQYTAERHGWTKFVSMQNHYNLLYREEEREMLPLCADQGVGVLPGGRPRRGRGGRPHRRRARRPARPGGPGLAAAPGHRDRPDRRRLEARAPGGRGGRRGTRPDRKGTGGTGAALHPAPRRRSLKHPIAWNADTGHLAKGTPITGASSNSRAN
jgi:aryl-alcohol dehydrogenase-like predicted oxidoreductase